MAAKTSASLDCIASRCENAACQAAGPQERRAAELLDFETFLRCVGVDPCADAHSLVMVAASHMFSAELPPEWSECFDEGTSCTFYHNRLTGESRWAHPQERTFRELVREVRSWRPEDGLEYASARSKAHLETVRNGLVEALAHWSAIDAEAPSLPGCQYFFNSETGESSWIDPRLVMEFDLLQRHDVLRECLAEQAERADELSDAEWDGSSDEGPMSPSPRKAWQPQTPRLEPACGRLEPARGTASRARLAWLPQVGAGDESVRSCVTYLSACSDLGCVEELDLDIRLAPTCLGKA